MVRRILPSVLLLSSHVINVNAFLHDFLSAIHGCQFRIFPWNEYLLVIHIPFFNLLWKIIRLACVFCCCWTRAIQLERFSGNTWPHPSPETISSRLPREKLAFHQICSAFAPFLPSNSIVSLHYICDANAFILKTLRFQSRNDAFWVSLKQQFTLAYEYNFCFLRCRHV